MSVNDLWEWQDDDKMAVLIADVIKKQKNYQLLSNGDYYLQFMRVTFLINIKSDKMGVKSW